MYRSFSDRVLGGICGGLGTLLPVNAWWLRVLFVVLAVATWGAFALLYLILWLAIPQESYLVPRRSGAAMLLLTIVLGSVTLAGWFIWTGGGLRGPGGEPVYWTGLLVLLAGIFFVRQWRG
jgi:phage shock protein PspC (stress-responsive transcriptional regulator)